MSRVSGDQTAPDPSNPRSWPVKRTESFGGVPVRTSPSGPEVALIRPHSEEGKVVWALPKGAKEEGEDAATAALREVREETGLEAEIECEIEAITYWFAWAPEQVRYRKTVHFYLMRVTGGDPRDHDHEVDEVAFFPLAEARRKATYPSERKVLTRAAELTRSW